MRLLLRETVMPTSTLLLFLVPAFTFYAITLQLPHAHPAISLIYRFSLASMCMFLVAWKRGELVKMSTEIHLRTFALGMMNYTTCYALTYNAERFAPSGLASLAFTLLVFLNPLAGVLFFRRSLRKHVILGAALGFVGVALIFGESLQVAASVRTGLWLLLGATFCSCAGNMLSLSLSLRGISPATFTAWGLFYGTLGFVVYAKLSGAHFVVPLSATYWGSLVYLAIFGTAVAFGMYTVLLQRIGPIAAYMSVVTPIGAVVLSIFFEHMQITLSMVCGIVLAIVGTFFALRPETDPETSLQS
jgi:drug/metabolite transporter (DMT)-like permease